MNDDPAVKDVLNAAADLPKKVGKSVLEAKIPVGAVKRVFRFALSHWVSGVLSLAILVWVTSHYVSQMQTARYVCHGPRAGFTLPDQFSTETTSSSAISISPISQFLAKATFSERPPEVSFDFKKFISENDPSWTYAQDLARAHNESDATALLEYYKGQTAAACIADRSSLTAVVVVGHALLAYLLFLAIGRGRRWLSEEMWGA